MIPPDALHEWPGAAEEWREVVERTVREVIAERGLPPTVAEADPANAAELRTLDWPAAPARVRACLGRDRADRLCDASDPVEGDVGRRTFQEEYAEWRMVCDERGPVRFELTTELPDYWELLAGHAPERAIEAVARFARAPVQPADVFGAHDPFAAASSVARRIDAFRAEMLGWGPRGEPDSAAPRAWPGPFNDGSRAITCMSHDDNGLGPLIALVVGAAAVSLRVIGADGRPRRPSGSEAIRELPPGSAKDGRYSDPLVVERLVALATEGRPIRLDDPVGVYVLDVQIADLLAPDGSRLPQDWCTLGRQGALLADGLPRPRRVEIEAPPAAGFTLAEVISRRTGEPIEHGAQIAELVQLGVYVRTGAARSVSVEVVSRVDSDLDRHADSVGCDAVHEVARRIEANGT